MRTIAHERTRRVIQVTHRALYLFTAGAMSLAGVLFSSAAFASGVQNAHVLTMIFFLGATGMLLALVVFYLLQARPR
jgi:hypothetical protein